MMNEATNRDIASELWNKKRGKEDVEKRSGEMKFKLSKEK